MVGGCCGLFDQGGACFHYVCPRQPFNRHSQRKDCSSLPDYNLFIITVVQYPTACTFFNIRNFPWFGFGHDDLAVRTNEHNPSCIFFFFITRPSLPQSPPTNDRRIHHILRSQ